MASREAAIGNGVQQGFTSGATRSESSTKIDYEGHISPRVQAIYGAYMNAHRIQRDGQARASDNWQLGIPLPNYMKSFIRHSTELWQVWRGYTVVNEDSGNAFTLKELLCALRFNIDGLILELDREGRLEQHVVEPSQRLKWEGTPCSG